MSYVIPDGTRVKRRRSNEMGYVMGYYDNDKYFIVWDETGVLVSNETEFDVLDDIEQREEEFGKKKRRSRKRKTSKRRSHKKRRSYRKK